jgi:hypothetical protein
MLELRVKQGRRSVPIFDLPAALGRAQAYRELGDTIDGLISFMDDLGGDPDLEETYCEDSFLSWAAFASGPGCTIADSDTGVDDEGEGIDEREPDDDDGYCDYSVDQRAGPLPLHLSSDVNLRRPHIERVRRESCRRVTRPDYLGRTHELVGA